MGAAVVRGHDWKWENQDGKQCMKYIIKYITKSMDTWESRDEGVITAVDVVIHDNRNILYADQTAKRSSFCPISWLLHSVNNWYILVSMTYVWSVYWLSGLCTWGWNRRTFLLSLFQPPLNGKYL